jgi:hypothetical protein
MKKIIVLAAMFFATATGFSQRLMYGVGLSVFKTTVRGASSPVDWAFTFSPRFNLIEKPDGSLSVGIPMSLGTGQNYKSGGPYQDNDGLRFIANLPLIINLNVGSGSTKDNEDRYGFFVGAGFGYHVGTVTSNYPDGTGGVYEMDGNVKTMGPLVDAGIRRRVGRSGINVELRCLYMKGISDSKANVFGGGLVINL